MTAGTHGDGRLRPVSVDIPDSRPCRHHHPGRHIVAGHDLVSWVSCEQGRVAERDDPRVTRTCPDGEVLPALDDHRHAAPECAGSGNVAGRAACHPGDMALRCLLVDDSPRFLEAARGLLEREGFQVVGVASNGAEAVQRARELGPDVTLVDLDLGDESGFDVVRRLESEVAVGSSVSILISTHAADDYADMVAANPAAGFLAKADLSGRAIRDLLGLP